MNKPHSAACDNNQEPIYRIIDGLFSKCHHVLEVGSGTGQHAVYFAEKMPHLTWQCSDLEENLAGIQLWLREASLANTPDAIILDVTQSEWTESAYDAVFSANAIHIMSWQAVIAMIAGVGRTLKKDGLLVLYGPFNYNNAYTSDSNARFDQWLKQRNPLSGIRNIEDVDELANNAGLIQMQDNSMPANNRLICWKKQ